MGECGRGREAVTTRRNSRIGRGSRDSRLEREPGLGVGVGALVGVEVGAVVGVGVGVVAVVGV